jgi:hypothetical protein
MKTSIKRDIRVYIRVTVSLYAILALILISTMPSASLIYGQMSAPMKKRTSGAGSLDVMLQRSSSQILKNAPTNFKVSFDQKGSNAIQPHIDYDFIIMKAGKQVFQATAIAGHPNQPLHTSEGIVTIPYAFQESGNYMITITIFGILFNPIQPESVQFSINVS